MQQPMCLGHRQGADLAFELPRPRQLHRQHHGQGFGGRAPVAVFAEHLVVAHHEQPGFPFIYRFSDALENGGIAPGKPPGANVADDHHVECLFGGREYLHCSGDSAASVVRRS